MKTIIKHLKEHSKEYVLLLCLILNMVYTSISIFNNWVESAKKDILIQEIKKDSDEKIKSASKPSDIELLWWISEELRRDALLKTEEASKLIQSAKISLLKRKCYKDQVVRLMNLQSYWLDYCEVLDNLEQYKLKK